MKLPFGQQWREARREKLSGAAWHIIVEAATTYWKAISDAIQQAERNVNPLYENIENAGRRLYPLGGIELSEAVLDAVNLAGLTYMLPKADHPLRPDSSLRVSMLTARDIRTRLEQEQRFARHSPDWRDSEDLEDVCHSITGEMEHLVASVDLAGDFEKAETVWRAIREAEAVLEPLLSAQTWGAADTRKFLEAWENRTIEQCLELQKLETAGSGLDCHALDKQMERGVKLRSRTKRGGAWAWLEKHPIPVAFALLVVIYVACLGWAHPLRFVTVIATMAFIDTTMLCWELTAELTRVREELDGLKTKEERRADDIAGLYWKIRRLSRQIRDLSETKSRNNKLV